MNGILYEGKMWALENQTKTGVREDSSLCTETSTKNAGQEFHLWIQIWILFPFSGSKTETNLYDVLILTDSLSYFTF